MRHRYALSMTNDDSTKRSLFGTFLIAFDRDVLTYFRPYRNFSRAIASTEARRGWISRAPTGTEDSRGPLSRTRIAAGASGDLPVERAFRICVVRREVGRLIS